MRVDLHRPRAAAWTTVSSARGLHWRGGERRRCIGTEPYAGAVIPYMSAAAAGGAAGDVAVDGGGCRDRKDAADLAWAHAREVSAVSASLAGWMAWEERALPGGVNDAMAILTSNFHGGCRGGELVWVGRQDCPSGVLKPETKSGGGGVEDGACENIGASQ